jgi:hypothetical protein
MSTVEMSPKFSMFDFGLHIAKIKHAAKRKLTRGNQLVGGQYAEVLIQLNGFFYRAIYASLPSDILRLLVQLRFESSPS